MKYLYLSIFISLLILPGCTTPRKMLREARLIEDQGMRKEAFERYQSVYRQYGRAEALVGMKRVAQTILDQQFSAARAQCIAGNYEGALAAYEQAFAYPASHPELELQVSVFALEHYESCRQDYVSSLYSRAEEAALSEHYDKARELIYKLKSIDRNHKQADYLLLLCDILPNYKLGLKAMELGLYRDAWIYFNEVTRLDAGYKDALALRDQCAEHARLDIAYIPVDNPDIDNALESGLSASVKQAILGLDDPLIRLLDRENLDQLVREQANGMSGLFDENTVIAAGRLTGARYILTGEIIAYEPMTAPQRGFERKAFLGPDTDDKKVRYMEYRLGRGLDVTYRYQLLDAETGQVYATQNIPFSERDNVVWADFEGDYRMLYPGDWKWQVIKSKEDVVRSEDRDELLSLFEGRKGPVSEMELRLRMMDAVSRQVANAIREFRPR